ncbi:MAG: hypothetical protein QM776_05825 [Rhodocyclaceae bacterium]
MKNFQSLIASMLMVGGCSLTAPVVSPETVNLDASKVVKLKVSERKEAQSGIDGFLMSITDKNGRKDPLPRTFFHLVPREATLLPGNYEVVVNCNGPGWYSYPRINIKAEPGVTYLISCAPGEAAGQIKLLVSTAKTSPP